MVLYILYFYLVLKCKMSRFWKVKTKSAREARVGTRREVPHAHGKTRRTRIWKPYFTCGCGRTCREHVTHMPPPSADLHVAAGSEAPWPRGVTASASTPNPQPSTLNPQPSTLNPQPSTLNATLKPSTLSLNPHACPQPSTLNPQPSTFHPQPSTLNLRRLNSKTLNS